MYIFRVFFKWYRNLKHKTGQQLTDRLIIMKNRKRLLEDLKTHFSRLISIRYTVILRYSKKIEKPTMILLK